MLLPNRDDKAKEAIGTVGKTGMVQEAWTESPATSNQPDSAAICESLQFPRPIASL